MTPALGICLPIKKPLVDHIYDGDTLKVSLAFSDVVWQIRLTDNWAPEITGKHKAKGIEARDALRWIISKADDLRVFISIDNYHRSVADMLTFGRLLGKIYADDIDVSDWMVDQGYSFRTKKEIEEAGLYGR